MRRDEVTLVDIDAAAEAAISHAAGASREAFFADGKTRSAVVFELLVIGEAVKRLSPEFRAAHPEVDWAPMAGMRNRLIHAYDDIDFNIVWDVVTGALPRLREQLKPWLPERMDRPNQLPSG